MGSGLGCARRNYNHIFDAQAGVRLVRDYFRNFMIDGGRPLRILDQILEQYKVVQHGVSMYFGSARRPTRAPTTIEGVGEADEDAVAFGSFVLGSVDGRYTHDLLPMRTRSRPRS